MKMDLKGLCARLGQAQEGEAVSARDGNDYLLNHVLRPMMRGNKVLLKDVDFDQFDSEDVRWLAGYYESLETQGGKLEQLVGAIANIEPAACKARRFC